VPEFVSGAGELSIHMPKTLMDHVSVITFGFIAPDVPTVAELNTLMGNFDTRFNSVIGTQWGIRKLVTRWQSNPDLLLVTESTAAETNFAGGTDSENPNVAVLVKKLTGVAGRQNRGRVYVPGALSGNVDSIGVLSSTAVDAWQTAFDSWFTDMVAVDMDPIINHADLSAVTLVTSFEVQSLTATQRRRLRP
jgi:hypothetical protein